MEYTELLENKSVTEFVEMTILSFSIISTFPPYATVHYYMYFVIDNFNFQDCFDVTRISEHHILRFFSFATVLLKILHRGLTTYNQSKYNQFSKRLSRFIRHVVQYATDQWEEFKMHGKLEDSAMLQRLQVEYDSFFLRATCCLFSSQKLGAWQFLAVVPYHMVSKNTLWKLFYFFHDSDNSYELLDNVSRDFREKLWDPSTRNQFEVKLESLSEAEVYYLLNTFANMALARKAEEMDLIKAVTEDLLQVCKRYLEKYTLIVLFVCQLLLHVYIFLSDRIYK